LLDDHDGDGGCDIDGDGCGDGNGDGDSDGHGDGERDGNGDDERSLATGYDDIVLLGCSFCLTSLVRYSSSLATAPPFTRSA